ncbi:Rossmann-fold NAD(P)-binding domain-containing protein [Litchfieldia alkalitelluris]|uniref:hypothetical protein n=1 Tax=Litchfieldia alkalitelluris TaxID=304268 RepID=UPI0009972C07|nr:hypothetical protein [Litchfieldia alkalitelluris]
MNSALILGGTQFVGKRLVQILIENGVKVSIATRGMTSDSFGVSVDRIIIDRENIFSMERGFDNRSWDVVFDQTCYSSEEAFNSIRVLEGKISKYIFTSSQAVYEFGTNHVEEDFNPFTFRPDLKNRQEYSGYIGYQEAKRSAEEVLFQQASIPVVAVRFPIIVGRDDFTKRLKMHVDWVKENNPIMIEHPDLRYGFIDSHEAATFLYQIAESDYQGPINPGSEGDISLRELI